MLDWQELEEECRSCQGCGLWETRHNVVFGVGKRDADIMFVGEGPGEQEDLRGEPFVGPAGQLLDEMLSIIDIDRTNCYIANIVKCRPPPDRYQLPHHQRARHLDQPPGHLDDRNLPPLRPPPRPRPPPRNLRRPALHPLQITGAAHPAVKKD